MQGADTAYWYRVKIILTILKYRGGRARYRGAFTAF
jgi:hypothetical protein